MFLVYRYSIQFSVFGYLIISIKMHNLFWFVFPETTDYKNSFSSEEEAQ